MMRDDAGGYLAIIEGLLRVGGRVRVDDVAQVAGLSFGNACSVVSWLDRDHLVRHLPRSGIFLTERGRALLRRRAV